MEILILLGGVVIGGLVIWLIAYYKFKSEARASETDIVVYEKQLASLKHELENKENDLKTERDKVLALNSELGRSQSDFRHMEQRLAEQKKEIENIQEKFYNEFKNLANQIFEEKSKKFTSQNKESLELLLKPLGQKITEFEKKVERSNQASLEWNVKLREQISGLKEMNLLITKEAENLTKALKGDSKIMGTWGEVILESILEKSGLQKGREYFIQESYNTSEGKRLQPDVVVKLPDDKNIIVDSKLSLVGYEKYVNESENKENRESYLRSHIQSIRNHLKSLDTKSYQKLYQIEGLDFVLMFIPIEPAFSLAIQHEPSLFNEAYDKNIVIVSPATLIATLRTIASIWKNEYQNRNTLEIARQGGDLYDKFVTFMEDLKLVGKHIEITRKVYVDAMKKLVEGKGNLVSRAERIKELGAKTSKMMDRKLIERAKEKEN
ncbi:MAG: DNA recombination protein RmuC [Bacteroidetes bacterium]|nr:DNA recombination protein RmuC [Bacteroidota bacterium]